MWQHVKNIYHMGIKELIQLGQDRLMLALMIYAFTAGVVVVARATPDSVQNGSVAVVDNDRSQLSQRLTDSFMMPTFQKPVLISAHEMDQAMDMGKFTFAIVFPPPFQRDVLAGNHPEIQVNVDATCMSQAFVGAGYIQQIVVKEIREFVARESVLTMSSGGSSQEAAANMDSGIPARIVVRDRYNQNLTASWFGGVNQMINVITMLGLLLIGAALIGERESGTLEHLLVMPVVPFEIMCAKIWSMLVVVLAATGLAVGFVLKGWLQMPIEGSIPLFLLGVALHLFAITSFGICIACVAQNMPQLGILVLLVLMPMQMLSGGLTPLECMPIWVQKIMVISPTVHFVRFSQQILFRGAGWNVVWEPFVWLVSLGVLFFIFAVLRFKKAST